MKTRFIALADKKNVPSGERTKVTNLIPMFQRNPEYFFRTLIYVG